MAHQANGTATRAQDHRKLLTALQMLIIKKPASEGEVSAGKLPQASPSRAMQQGRICVNTLTLRCNCEFNAVMSFRYPHLVIVHPHTPLAIGDIQTAQRLHMERGPWRKLQRMRWELWHKHPFIERNQILPIGEQSLKGPDAMRPHKVRGSARRTGLLWPENRAGCWDLELAPLLWQRHCANQTNYLLLDRKVRGEGLDRSIPRVANTTNYW